MNGMWPVRAICNAPRKGFTECAFPSDAFLQARAPSALRHSTFHITYFPPPKRPKMRTAIRLSGLYDAPARDANSQCWDRSKEKTARETATNQFFLPPRRNK
jgi:hypothetical protein